MTITLEVDVESLLKILGVKQNYPPYDFIKLDEEHFILEIAVAGFKQSDLQIELDGAHLVISSKLNNAYANAEFLHKAIARRNFKHIFKISDELILNEQIQLLDGILRLLFVRKKPSTENKRILQINTDTDVISLK